MLTLKQKMYFDTFLANLYRLMKNNMYLHRLMKKQYVLCSANHIIRFIALDQI